MDSEASSSCILEAYNPKNLVQREKSSQITWSTMGDHFTTDKTGLVTFFLPGHSLKKQISWMFHVDDLARSSNTYEMIISRRCSWRMRLNLSNHTVTILIEDRGAIYTQYSLLEVYLA
jgi:hypothetical protein